jgi:SAM-dependent methyltransferase
MEDRAGPDGWLVSADGRHRYPVRGGIPRFVPQSNYADNFGMQWNHFARTQLDSHSGHPISADRFWKATAWNPSALKDRWVLDVGCGSGRFAEIALSTGAHVVALDYSSAVDACAANLGHHPRFHVVQGDIFALPFAPGSFDFIYSLGVLQHTPDVAQAFAALPPMLVGGGRLCVDYYEHTWWKAPLHPKFWLRPVTQRMDRRRLFNLCEAWVPTLLGLSNAVGGIPLIGRALRRMVPVANYCGVLPLSPAQLREWALLDTFDWLSPAYDNPQTAKTVRLWLERAGLSEIEVLKAGHLVGRGTANTMAH